MNHNEESLIKLEELVGRLDRLPPLPESIQRINSMIDGKQTTLDAVGQEIAKDQAISAEVLHLVNSSFYGFSEKVSSIKHAVVLLGLNAIRTIVGSSWVSGIMQDFSIGFHHHSVATARACYILSKSLGVGEPEEVSALGLLHDIGKVVLAKFLPEEFKQVCELAQREHICFHEAEMEVMGVTHASLGASLLEKWNLPSSTVIPIEYHHYSELPTDFREEAALLKLANLMLRAEGYGYVADHSIPEFHEEIAEELDLEVGDLHMLSNEICDQMAGIPRYIGARAI
jgi:putative nucleotidyltransferase with HDIG domain